MGGGTNKQEQTITINKHKINKEEKTQKKAR